MKETSKATNRRRREDLGYPPTQEFWDDRIFKGVVLDVGSGDDPLVWGDTYIVPFDTPQGDANKIDQYYPPDKFDCVHGSQVMEHMFDPVTFFDRCLKITKPGGYVVMTIPDFDLYEHRVWPSQYNGDHKTCWSLWRTPKDCPRGVPMVHVPGFVKRLNELGHDADCRLITTNYDFLKQDIDQTFKFEDGVECFIEIICRKK